MKKISGAELKEHENTQVNSSRNLSGKLACLVIAGKLGVTSEVWLQRQILGFSRLAPGVVCWERENREIYPLDGVTVHELPFDSSADHGRGRWLKRLRNALNGNYFGVVGAERHCLTRIFREAKPSVVLCHFGTTSLRTLPVALATKTPIVAHFHGVDISAALRNPWYRSSLEKSIHRFDAMVVVANYQREQLLQLGANAVRIHVIPCGSPISEMPESITRSHDLDKCQFVFVGRFVPKKNPLATLQAFAYCRERQPAAVLEMIGEGPLLDETKQLAAEMGLADAVKFLGRQPNDAVFERLAAADVYVQHSVTTETGDKEGWPVSIAEAMGIGLPVIATRHAGIVDQVVEGETGFLVNENDWLEMGKKMVEISAPAVRSACGEASRRRAIQQFDVNLKIAELEEVLLACASQ